ELARILLRHPRLTDTPPLLLGRPEEGGPTQRLTDLHPRLAGLPHADDAVIEPWTWDLLQQESIDLLLLGTPHEQSRIWVPEALARGIRVIDLSGAWRLADADNRAVYKFDSPAPELAQATQAQAVYGSPELNGPAITSARLVANPGCYATSVILALAPIVRAHMADLDRGIVVDSKSGVSGAGKTPSPTTHFMYAADNLSAYAVFGHRHTGELLEQLHLTADQIQFTPHLLPIPRGILSTIYVRLAEPTTPDHLQALYEDFYRDSPTVRIRPTPTLPQIQHVVRTPFCDIGFHLDSNNPQRLIVVSCLDNLLKGAASQAVENMNLMAGWPQVEGLL
ncbi:MAG TPA: N-acetyl-gamma-glutamyl-phosphate reductase, partial [Acidobacteriaceae bacterium]|nr:N-acetyl-gamma-glutamyl-phosphate reductase [Acidobacteriaceae bacterium]